MHIHATDPSVALHRVVRILRFVLRLVSVSEESEQLASIWPLAENCSKLKAIHSMSQGAGRGKPDGPKRVPIALGSFASTVGTSLIHCMPSTIIEDTAGPLEHYVQIPGTISPQVHKSGAELRSRLSLQLGAAPQFNGAELLTLAVKRDQAADETCCAPGTTQ